MNSFDLLLAVLVALAYSLLMRYEFFVPALLRRHFLVYAVSHMLIMPLIDLYATACDWWPAGHRRPPDGLFWFLIVSFFNGLAIEVGRKIRAREDEEHGVETYSKLWGLRGAIAAWMSAIAATAAAAFVAASLIGSEVIVGYLLVVLLIVCAVAAARFLQTPNTSTGKRIEVMAGIWTLGMYLSLGVLPLVGQHVAHGRVSLFGEATVGMLERRVERCRGVDLAEPLDRGCHLVQAHVDHRCNQGEVPGVAAGLDDLRLRPLDLRHAVADVDRHADRAAGVLNGASDGLADPPGNVG